MTETPRAPIDSRQAFRAAVIALASAADGERAPVEWWWCDADFADWPLDDPALIAALGAWLARPGRQLTLLACGFDELVRRHPRFVAWRRHQAHRVLGREVAVDASQMPTLFVARAPQGFEVLDRVRWRGVWFEGAEDWRQRREIVDALQQQSVPSFAATTLGL
ncbi:hypothetical protein [Azohydromonas sediminis]|uniref:hypothetical protein n=1 Tax=Azohydromonas sediminis TaxID=2259674 RepID=UPI000E64C093|nr:hypothetical protein [Azohydromonas sediminis]